MKQGFGEFFFIACILYALAWFGLLGRSVRWVQGILIAERIAKQPLSEQGYIRDVSFDGPFLAPLY